MRIATSQIYGGSVSSLLDQQARLAKTQEQLATGNRINNPADDPIGSVRAQGLERALDKTEQYTSNSNILEGRLRLEEETVSNSIEILQRVRSIAIQANNPVHSAESLDALKAELRQEVENLMSYANTRDSDGRYIFSGYQNAAPFSNDGDVVVYSGDDGQRQLQVAPSRTLADSDPGSKVFMGILDGNGRFAASADAGNQGDAAIALGTVVDNSQFNGAAYSIQFIDAENFQVLDENGAVVSSAQYSEGTEIIVGGMSVTISGSPQSGDEFQLRAAESSDVFAMLGILSGALENLTETSADRGIQVSKINSSISNIDQALNHLINVQSSVGARLGALETQVDINAGANLRIQESLGEIKDLDYASAISRFNQQMAGLEAAQQVFGKVQSLSLFNYL
jgi:flagellar hook-associated protein 3 FlgL